MFLLFHIALPLLFGELLREKVPSINHRFSLILGALLPDLIDKPLGYFFYGNGRSIFHSPFVYICLILLLFIILKQNYLVKSLACGILFHLLLDLPDIPLFWPFIEYSFPKLNDYFDIWLYIILHDPVVLITEIMGLIIILGFIKKYTLYHSSYQIKVFLFNFQLVNKDL